MINKLFKQVFAILILAPLAFTAVAQPEKYVSGTHYTTIGTPVRTNDASKIEVIEVFWYGCGHCFRFQPLIENWHANKPADVDFLQLPAVWNDLMKVHAQAYYAIESLGAVDKAHTPIFNAINLDGNRLQNERQLIALVTQHGVSEADFTQAFNSFSVRTKANQLAGRMQAYQIQSTPNMVVNGKYLITTNEAVRTQQEMLEVVDFLVAKERAAL